MAALTSGYDQDPAAILKLFEDGAEQYNELIVVRGIPVYNHCEHHLAPPEKAKAGTPSP